MGGVMKNFKKVAIILALLVATITLSGCGPILQHGIHALGPEAENGIYRWAGRQDPVISEGVRETPKESFLNQCLMNESHTPAWCVKRAEEAFSNKTTEEKKVNTKGIKKGIAKTHGS
jgi:hypothetical protein